MIFFLCRKVRFVLGNCVVILEVRKTKWPMGSQALLRISGIQLRYGVPGPASLEPLCLLMVRLSGTYLRYGVPGLARRLLLSPRVMTPVRHYYNLGEALPPVSVVLASRAEKGRRQVQVSDNWSHIQR